MGDAYWAAREGDILLHTSMLADIVGAAVEIATYAAITAAAAFLLFGSITTGGLAFSLVVGIVMAMTGGDNVVSNLADWVSSIFPLNEDGKITTGSPNTRINSKPAARAAGTIDPSIELSDNSEQPQQPTEFFDIAAGILNGLWEVAKELFRPTVATPDPRAVPRNKDKITCAKHPSPFGEDEYLAEGSSKVYINGQPAVRSNDRSTCEAKVTDNCEDGIKVSNNVRIGGEPIVVRPIRSGKHPIALGIGILTSLKRPNKRCTQIACLMINLAINGATSYAIASVAQAVTRGNPVHLPTGAKLLAGSEDLDFTIPAHLPIEWQRFYSSIDTRTHNMFGAGWSVPYEVEIEISPQPDGSCTAVYINEQGRRIEIEALQPGEGILIVSENISIRRGEQNRWVIEDDDGIYRLFEPDPNQPNRLYLTLLQDRNDNRLFIYRDQHSRISHISDDSKAATISLHYQDKHHPQRVTQIRHQLADGSSRLLSQYHYSEQGDLQQVIDPENRPTREFAYDNGRRMTYHRLPTGLQCYYQWQHFDGAAETAWRVIHHWSEADGKRLEDYHFHYDLEQRLTTVHDSLGRSSKHYWNEVYQITRYTDP
uniref:DUF6531 domain-containing protein n=1 Tax=Snodgrassella communis TaxID=2946699 RepID=UPI001EF6CA91